ncbi:hypothetical protein ECZU29_63040 [Escherichia coli]|nr:hypothetical protein ECZU29_63040 [Escherichia coli]
MWDAVLDIGRPDTAQEMLPKAEAFDEADDGWNQSRSHRRGKNVSACRYRGMGEEPDLRLEAA